MSAAPKKPRDQRNLQHAEVIRARIPDIAFILLALRYGAPFHDKTDCVAVALQRQLGRHRNILDARQSPHFFGEAALELKSARVIFVRIGGGAHGKRQQVLRFKSGVLVHQRADALHHQARARQQNQRESNFHHYKTVAQPRSFHSRGPASGLGSQTDVHIRARHLQRGSHAEHQSGDYRCEEGENQHRRVNVDRL
jgi:hypothetical protein